ncbi:arginyltransferase [Oceanicoccus sp. KOV_DT_Chl]|uniref:arginyltransferase n=1 Tax=Oceanicoccus sp. KOV_DT_Chl TaxID=1904639 RepID=UPI000C7A9EA9|nr:arginyltransferase [Oceanicoccus sp. KOV_DT_Chl]
MTALAELKVFATHPHPCSYLPDQQATTLFIDPETTLDSNLYSDLADVGFRRSGPHVYRPHCESCNACIATRVDVNQFKPTRRQRKIHNRNQDLQVLELDSIDDEAAYQLYMHYITVRHQDGDMFPPSREQYDSFLNDSIGVTRYYGFHLNNKIIAVAVTDQMRHGLSAIYTFFDPEHDRRSLGTYAVLWQIEQTRKLGLDHLYLGYWIKECQKMSYKTDYRPLQLLINNRWLTLS